MTNEEADKLRLTLGDVRTRLFKLAAQYSSCGHGCPSCHCTLHALAEMGRIAVEEDVFKLKK